MAYSGFISDPNYTRKNIDESISGKWVFEDSITFKKTINGTTIAAYYGDIAENYQTGDYEVIPHGSLVKFGGEKEITKTSPHDRNFFGIVSTDPAYILNKKDDSKNYVMVALSGRVPVRVIGNVNKFDKLTTSKINGVAKKKTFVDVILLKPTIGVALDDNTSNIENIIEVYTQSNI